MNQCKIILKVSLLKSTWGRKSGFFLPHITQPPGLDQFSATYDNLIQLGDFNVEPEVVNELPDSEITVAYTNFMETLKFLGGKLFGQ